MLGLALTAFFWAPALYDLQYTIARQDYYLTRSDFRLRLLSLRDLLAPPIPLDSRLDNPYVPFSLGVSVVVLAALGILYLLSASTRLTSASVRNSKPGEMRREVIHLSFFLLVLLITVFLMLRPAAPLWENLPFLPYAEFHWRLMGLLEPGQRLIELGELLGHLIKTVLTLDQPLLLLIEASGPRASPCPHWSSSRLRPGALSSHQSPSRHPRTSYQAGH